MNRCLDQQRRSAEDEGASALTSRLARWRLHSLGLTAPRALAPVGALRSLTATQARDYAGATWSLARRTSGATTAKDIDRLLDDGAIVRTHVLRPTRHLVARDDLRDLLRWTAPGVQAAHAPSYRRNGLDDATLARCNDVLAGALAGTHLTAEQLGESLHRSGIAGATGERLASILLHAELSAVICSGPMKRNRHTYALLDERVPPSPDDKDPSELVLRYVTSHGPVTAESCAWWTGLASDVVSGAIAAVELRSVVVDDVTYWVVAGSEPVADPVSPQVLLLTAGDEYAVGYGPTPAARDGAAPDNLVLLDGVLAGQWRRTVRRSHVAVDVALDRQWGRAELLELSAEAERHGAFLGLRTRVTAAVGPTVMDSLTTAAREAAPWLFPD